MGPLLTAIIPALIPAAVDGLRGLFARLTGGRGAQPQNVQEALQLMQADTARLQALAQLDSQSGNISGWVANVRALQRPVAGAAIIFGYMGALALGDELPAEALERLATYAEMVTFYLFGDRSYMYLRAAKR